MEKSLTIIIPAYNESLRITKTLNDIDAYIKNNPTVDFKVIIVNDGSLDNTKEVVTSWINKNKNENWFKILSYVPNRGKGYAVREGVLNSSTNFVIYTDADGASPIIEVEKLLDWIDKGYDIAVGSRILKSENTKVTMTVTRRFIGLVFHTILKFLNLADIKDTQCGFKLFKTQAAKKIAQNQLCFNYSFDIEYLFLAKRFGYKVKEVPINWYHVEGSKVSIVRDSIKMLIEVLKIRFIYKYNNTEMKAKGKEL